tara:strand:+ start:81 stop:428 length:348 start_codon:yes stop_codon:yes gene_type:complete
MKKIIFLLLPLMSFAQSLPNVDYTGIHTIHIQDDLYFSQPQIGTIIATKSYEPSYSFPNKKGKVISSFNSYSDQDALIEYQWKSDYITRPGGQTMDALVKGADNKYYIIRYDENY